MPASPIQSLDDLGRPPAVGKARRDWVRDAFVEIGNAWYALDPRRGQTERSDLEDLAVQFLREHRADLPGKSTLRSAVANTSFFPSVVNDLWDRAFPPSAAERAAQRSEWVLIDNVAMRVRRMRNEEREIEAEALRKAAVTFFNRWLVEGEVDDALRAKARGLLRP